MPWKLPGPKRAVTIRLGDKSFYHSGRWKSLRKWWLQHNPLCAVCQHPGSHVDHIKPIAEGGSMMDITNLQTLCHSHHSKKTYNETIGR